MTSQSDDVTFSVGEKTTNQRNNYSIVVLLLCRWRRRKMREAKGHAKMGWRRLRERVFIFVDIKKAVAIITVQFSNFETCRTLTSSPEMVRTKKILNDFFSFRTYWIQFLTLSKGFASLRFSRPCVLTLTFTRFDFQAIDILNWDLISSLNVTETCSVMSGVSITTGTKSTGPDTEKKINICDTQLGQCQKAIMVRFWIDIRWVFDLWMALRLFAVSAAERVI